MAASAFVLRDPRPCCLRFAISTRLQLPSFRSTDVRERVGSTTSFAEALEAAYQAFIKASDDATNRPSPKRD